jgi:hypothetical protein
MIVSRAIAVRSAPAAMVVRGGRIAWMVAAAALAVIARRVLAAMAMIGSATAAWSAPSSSRASA